MAEQPWPEVWRAWLRTRYGDRLDADTLEAAVAVCEELRVVWQPLLAAEPDNGELPFPNALPALPPLDAAASPDGEEPA